MPKNWILIICMCCAYISAQSQTAPCPAVACNDNVQISLDNMCSGVTLDMLLEGETTMDVKIFITGENGKTVSAESAGLSEFFYNEDGTVFEWSPYVGETINYTVVSQCDGNSCWGEAKLELNQLPTLDSPCVVTPGAVVEKIFKFADVIAGPQIFTYPINDPTCQIPADVTGGDDLLYACSLGDDGVLGTSDDGWCTASCTITDDLAGTITVVFNPSLGDPTGIAIPASALCKVKVVVPPCTSCIAWCSEKDSRSYPEGFVTVDDIYEMVNSGCFANIEGDIKVVENVIGDACESLTTISYYANVNIHGKVENILLLEQAFKTVKLDPNHVNAPSGPVILDCGSVNHEALPEDILAVTGSGSQAFPWFKDKHTQIPQTIRICGLDHYEVVVDTMEQLVAVDVDTDKDGIDDSQVWVLLPVVQKEIRDSIYCERVGIAEDGNILVYDADGKCLGDGTDYILSSGENNPIAITRPKRLAGNGATAPGSTTCEAATVPAIVHIDDGKYCNLIVSYSDQGPFEACGSGFKIIRTWQSLDWCDGTVGSIHLGSQFIEVIDTEAPVFPKLVDDAVSIDPWTCFAKYPLNIPTADDGCEGTTISYDIDVSAGRYDPVSGYIVDLYVQDSIAIHVEVSDDCYNVARDTFTLTVYDGVAPVPVCHENLTVTLTTGGSAKVFARDFDAGSHDAGCGDVQVYAARMTGCCDEECAGGQEICLEYNKFGNCVTYGNSPETDEYGEFVKFCCQDAGQKVMVAILVVDAAGNKNTCMIEVTVVDKSAVTLACEDVVVNCQDDIDEVSSASAIAAVCEGGAPDLLSETFNETGCGTGSVIREWWIDRDASGDLTTGDAYCEQTITILPTDEHAFDPNTIKWPVHYTGEIYEGINLECNDEGRLRQFDGEQVPMGEVFACSSADLEDAPVWCSSPCGLVGYSVEEETVVASDACLKVIKRWSVIDWCKWDPNGTTPVDDANDTGSDSFIAVADWTDATCHGCDENQAGPYYFKYDKVDLDGYYTFDQVIKVVDDSDPSITVPATYVQSTDGGATSKEDDTKCFGSGTVVAVARDQCGGEDSGAEFLSWTIKRYENGELVTTKTDTGETVEMGTGEGSPGDTHKIEWIASDGCGNSTKTETIVTFSDDKAPTPLCVSGVTTAFMEASGTVDIWAKDFDLGSFDNCTGLEFTMVLSGVDPALPGSEEFDSQKNYTLVCDDITTFAEFNVWVWDANGIGDFCTVGVLVGGECNTVGGSGILIAGSIQTEYGDMIEGVRSEISSAALTEYPKGIITGANGQYAFGENPEGYDFEISARKDGDEMNGVSTLDLVLIQKHILGISPFDSGYKTIAADANNDGRVTATDLLGLRRLILGIDDSLPNNDSWRFAKANQSFVDTSNPWPFVETIQVTNLITNLMDENFIGIKVGDVNGNAAANNLSRSEVRTEGLVSMQTEDKSLASGEIVRIPVSSASFKDVYGFQFTLELDGLTYRDVESGKIEVSEKNFGLFGNTMTMSWENAEAVSTNETLFTLVFEATSTTQLSQALSINSNKINSEMYVGNTLDAYTVDMAFNQSVNDVVEMSLSQNDPNPFSVETTISFVLPQKADATIQITNTSGEVIRSINGQYNKGVNSVTLSRDQLNLSTGLYYYTLESDHHSITKKMIVVNE